MTGADLGNAPREVLRQIARALDRMAPPAASPVDWMAHPAYLWRADAPMAIDHFDALPLDRLVGIDRQKRTVLENIERLALGVPAHDMLLWGARGMGKSALLRSCVAHLQASDAGRIALIQVDISGLATLPELYQQLADRDRNYLLLLDDLGFDAGDGASLRYLRSAMEGGIPTRPGNVALAVTSNHRAIISRGAQADDDTAHQRDRMDDVFALSDRFGIRIGFHPCDKETYLAIVAAHAGALGVEFTEDEAMEWSRTHGQMSGRSARHFVTEMAGRTHPKRG